MNSYLERLEVPLNAPLNSYLEGRNISSTNR